MYGYIYKTTNLVNGKIYIGQRKSNKFLGNKYLGSGRVLRKAVEKYGKSSFEVTLLEEVEKKEDMDSREIYWIKYYHATDDTIGYNLSEGGFVNRTLVGKHNPFYGKKHTQESKRKMSESLKGITPWNKGLTKDTDERVAKYAQTGKKHIQLYGSHAKDTIWIHKETTSKMIKKTELDTYLVLGWQLGRGNTSNFSHLSNLMLNRVRINNGQQEKAIKKEELELYIKKGWVKGRLKFKDTSNFGKHVKKSVLCIETGIVYESCKEVYEKIGIFCSQCCRGQKKTAGGYHWQFVK